MAVFGGSGFTSQACAEEECWGAPASACGPSCYHGMGPLGGRLWLEADYLLWWGRGFHVPPLLTTSPEGTQREDAGVLPDAAILVGNERLASGVRSGGRFTLGCWLTPCRRTAWEVVYLGLGEETSTFSAASEGDPILARPFFNIHPETGEQRQDAMLVAFDDVVEGTISVQAATELQSVEVLRRQVMQQRCGWRSDFLAGWRFSRLDDGLQISEALVTGPDNLIPEGTTIDLFDRFATENVFNGFELGVVGQLQRRRWSLELLTKLAIGSTRSRVWIDGSTTTTVPGGGPVTTEGGFLAQPTNIGAQRRSDFTAIPELGITLEYALGPRLRATFGYTLIYWSKVARPGDQIDFDLNPTQFSGGDLVGAPRPEARLVTDDFWAQGLNFGVHYRF